VICAPEALAQRAKLLIMDNLPISHFAGGPVLMNRFGPYPWLRS
jgi:hypothetical protein